MCQKAWDVLDDEDLGACAQNKSDGVAEKVGTRIMEACPYARAREGLAWGPCNVEIKVRRVEGPAL